MTTTKRIRPSEGSSIYVMVEVAIHGIDHPADDVAARVRTAIAAMVDDMPTADPIRPRLVDDVEVRVIEHAGGRCSECPHE